MEYHYVLTWSADKGWYLDWGTTIAKFNNNNIYVPNIDTWVFPSPGSESEIKEKELLEKLQNKLDEINKG